MFGGEGGVKSPLRRKFTCIPTNNLSYDYGKMKHHEMLPSDCSYLKSLPLMYVSYPDELRK